MKSEIPGMANAHVVDSVLLRSGEITDFSLAIPALRNLNLGRVICLYRAQNDGQDRIDKERLAFAQAQIPWFNRPLNSSGVFGYSDGPKFVPAILDLIATPLPTGQRTLVHCKHGEDRTGVVVACFRIRFYQWTAERAIDEMRQFGNAFYNRGMREFVEEFSEQEKAQAARRNR